LIFKDAQQIYRFEALLQFDWLEHGFGTRQATVWNGDPQLVTVRQIHSSICLYADGRSGCIGRGDALITDIPGPLLAVRTADCLPTLLVDTKRKSVGAVHAGWRGTVQRITLKAIAAMMERFSTDPSNLHAAIGPGIGFCCYEVGPEVAGKFQDFFPERDLLRRTHIDLAEANRRQLLEAGVSDRHIYLSNICTSCSAEEFASWRREREQAGRMLSVIRIKG
jgi:YfiH family protein